MIVWLNGTHGSGKTTASTLLQPLLPDSRVFDAEKVGETLMDIRPGLPGTDNFQQWPPWRPLVVDTARRVLDYTGGTFEFRPKYLQPYAEAEVVDTTYLTPAQAALQIAKTPDASHMIQAASCS